MPDILLKDASGKDVAYENVNTISVRSTAGGTEAFVSETLIQKQVQADWAQTDETAVDYIKNKPETFESEAELPEVTVEDEGKFLGVLNGAWQKVDAPSGGGGGGSSGEVSVQADWAQNDSTQANYIKNRPFYTGGLVEQDPFVEGQTAFFYTSNFGIYLYEAEPTDEQLELWQSNWEEAIFWWEGIQYICKPKDLMGIKAIGNIEAFMGTGNSEEPFIFGLATKDSNWGRQAIICCDLQTTHTEETVDGDYVIHDIKASIALQEIKKLDPKYLENIDYETQLINKPFGASPAGTTVIDTTITLIESGSSAYALGFSVDKPSLIIPDNTYIITIDGIEYTGKGEIEELSDGTLTHKIRWKNGGLLPYVPEFNTSYIEIFDGSSPIGQNISLKVITREEVVQQIDAPYLGIVEEKYTINELLPNTNYTTALISSADDGTDYYGLNIETTLEMDNYWQAKSAGEMVWVEFDGIPYECPVQDLLGKIVGDCSVLFKDFGGTGNNEPFVLAIAKQEEDDGTHYYWRGFEVKDVVEGATHTIKVYEKNESQYLIKEEYLSILEEEKKELLPYSGNSYASYLMDADMNIWGFNIGGVAQETFDYWQENNSKNVFIEYDSILYECSLQNLENYGKVVGNCSFAGGTSNNEPFAIALLQTSENPSYSWIVIDWNDTLKQVSNSHDIRVYQDLHQIKEEYLPEDIMLPESSSSDSGKVLTVSDNGTAAWTVPASGLPTVDSSFNNKILKVLDGEWTAADEIAELPTFSTEDNNKFLRIVNGVPTWVALTDVSIEGA